MILSASFILGENALKLQSKKGIFFGPERYQTYVRLQTKTETKPMLEINVGANIRFDPTLVLLICKKCKKRTCMIICFYWQEVENFEEKHKIIGVTYSSTILPYIKYYFCPVRAN